jgi:zinc transporter ZupT
VSRKKRRHYNGPPKGAVVIYKNSPHSSFAHQWFPPPVGYVFAVLLGIFALLLPAIAFCTYITWHYQNATFHILLGMAGGFIFGIGLFNFVAIILHQYLGHLVSILCFLIGGIMMAASLSLLR